MRALMISLLTILVAAQAQAWEQKIHAPSDYSFVSSVCAVAVRNPQKIAEINPTTQAGCVETYSLPEEPRHRVGILICQNEAKGDKAANLRPCIESVLDRIIDKEGSLQERPNSTAIEKIVASCTAAGVGASTQTKCLTQKISAYKVEPQADYMKEVKATSPAASGSKAAGTRIIPPRMSQPVQIPAKRGGAAQ